MTRLPQPETVWTVPPENQGQIVERAYCAVDSGAIQRTTDYSDRSVIYRLYPWLKNGKDFQPWSGSPRGVSCRQRGHIISENDVTKLLLTLS